MIKYRTDWHDPNPHELMLIRAGHHLWLDRRKKGLTVSEREAIYEALETIWEAKRKLRAELAKVRRERGRAFAERMRATREELVCI